jgi:acid phosphatase
MVALCGCGGPETSTTSAPTGPATHADASTPTAFPTATGPPSVTSTAPTKVLVVVEENKSASTALEQMPYLAALADQYLRTSNYRAVTHPSLPNYLAIAAGSTFGISDDDPPERHPITQVSVFDEALAAGRTVRTFAESMPHNCTLTDSGRYAVKHNPWAYFSVPVSRANCQRFDVPAGTPDQGALHDDVLAGTLPTIGLLIPDLCNDAHDCSMQVADSWLRQWIPFVTAGPDYQAGRLAIVVTFDEDDRTAGNNVLTTIISPNVSAMVSATPLNHYSLARYFAELAGVPPLNQAAQSPSLAQVFTS